MFRRTSKENKTKLEHKLYLAREDPDSQFDISECGLHTVPSGIYSLCRVFLKDSLHLQGNSLSSLSGGGELKDLSNLKLLNLSSNAFTVIPDDILRLVNIKELYLNHNQLKTLPSSICSLKRLQVLDVSHNALNYLPEQFGNLENLEKLDLRENPKLSKLPQSFHTLYKLGKLYIDDGNFKYPPNTADGIQAIQKCLCEDLGLVYVQQPQALENITESTEVDSSAKHREQIWEIEDMKQKKTAEFLEIERQQMLQQRQELELAMSLKKNKEMLLTDITNQQNRIDSELSQIQRTRDRERHELLKQIEEDECRTDVAVQQLLRTLSLNCQLATDDEERHLAAATVLVDREHAETLRRNDVLVAMEAILTEETERFRAMDKSRVETTQNILERELENDQHLHDVLVANTIDRTTLVSRLHDDSQLQRSAVAALLSRSDTRSWSLVQQVRLVESQLATLTSIEMERKKLEVDEHLNDLSEKRINLSILLMDLLEQQSSRRAQLLSTLKDIEDNYDSAEDFWLRKYQQLLESLPADMMEAQRNINPLLAESLLMVGVIHCLPFLARICQKEDNLLSITEEDLEKSGIKNSEDKSNILKAFQLFYKQEHLATTVNQPVVPSAPLEDVATAPPPEDNETVPRMSSECVICMDSTCGIIFVPCGHLCCCKDCSLPLVECPLCRGAIENKIKVIL